MKCIHSKFLYLEVDAAFGEILTTAEKLKWMINNAESILSPQYRPTNLLLLHKLSKVKFYSFIIKCIYVNIMNDYRLFMNL